MTSNANCCIIGSMNKIKAFLTFDVPLWVVVSVYVLLTVLIQVPVQDPTVDPKQVTQITLTGEGGESILSFRIETNEEVEHDQQD